jgi:hypothetical protein
MPPKAPKPRAVADGVAVWCAHDELVDVAKLVPNPRNPNTHPEAQVALLAKIILAQGWRNVVTVSKRSGFIVKGHGRRDAALLAGKSVVPVEYQDYESEAAEHADLVADNRIAELAEIDRATLKDVLEELDTGAWDMDLTGFDAASLEELMTVPPFGEDPGGAGGGMDNLEPKKCPKCGTPFVCPECGHDEADPE